MARSWLGWLVLAGVAGALLWWIPRQSLDGPAPVAGSPAPESGPPPADLARAVFAGGCFWCMEHPFDALEGVYSTTSGYAGGATPNPTYAGVSSGTTGHTEVVEVAYDPARVSYAELLEIFWVNIDPVAVNRQFCDSGSQYRSAIFYSTPEQRAQAEASLEQLERSGRFDAPIATEIAPLDAFYRAEEYHQDYYEKNPIRYRYYRTGCGRDRRLSQLWGDPPELELGLEVTSAARAAGASESVDAQALERERERLEREDEAQVDREIQELAQALSPEEREAVAALLQQAVDRDEISDEERRFLDELLEAGERVDPEEPGAPGEEL